MTLTFELDLDILPHDLHTKNQVRMSVRSPVRVVTDTQKDGQTMSKLLHPIADAGCNNMKSHDLHDLFPLSPLIDFKKKLTFGETRTSQVKI